MPQPSQSPQPRKDRETADSPEELADLLREAVRHSVQIEREAALAGLQKPSRARPIALGVICVALFALSAWSFIARPEFIWGPRVAAFAPERAEANARVAMYIMAKRAEAIRARDGELPDGGEEVGATQGFTYARDGDAFTISTRLNGRDLTLRSDEDAQAFLGNSRDLIQQKVGR